MRIWTWHLGISDTDIRPVQSYMEFVSRRIAETLLTIIKKILRPGSVIKTDEWVAYNRIRNLWYVHKPVNHSRNFANPNDETNT